MQSPLLLCCCATSLSPVFIPQLLLVLGLPNVHLLLLGNNYSSSEYCAATLRSKCRGRSKISFGREGRGKLSEIVVPFVFSSACSYVSRSTVSSQNVMKSKTVEYYQDTTERVSLTAWSISERVSLADYLKDPPLLSIH